jgi:hypothetical protein
MPSGAAYISIDRPAVRPCLRRATLGAIMFTAALVGFVVLLYLGLEPNRFITLGPAVAYPARQVIPYPEHNIILVVDDPRAEDGFRALSDIDPYTGCVVRWSTEDDLLHDPCFGTIYDRQGRVLGGPSSHPLTPLPTIIQGGGVTIQAPDLSRRPISPIPGPWRGWGWSW